jgi:hypothetical protein
MKGDGLMRIIEKIGVFQKVTFFPDKLKKPTGWAALTKANIMF